MVDEVVPDIIATHLDILFCGINPGLVSASTHHHFARPGNRFWKAVHLSGLTPHLLKPSEQTELLNYGIGITNFVTRASATAQELRSEEFVSGAKSLQEKVLQLQPKYLALLGIDAYKKGFGIKTASLGLQPTSIGSTKVWLLPNPSGLNAHYSLEDFVELFSQLRQAAKQ